MERLRNGLAVARRLRRGCGDAIGGEQGATATEYALLVGVVVLVVAVGVGTFGTALAGWFGSLATGLTGWLG